MFHDNDVNHQRCFSTLKFKKNAYIVIFTKKPHEIVIIHSFIIITVKENDDCEFTVADDPNQQGKLMATRIKILSPGSVQFSAIIHQDNLGKVESEPSSSREADGSSGTGKILYELNGLNLEIPLHANDCDLRQFPHKGDIVRYVII